MGDKNEDNNQKMNSNQVMKNLPAPPSPTGHGGGTAMTEKTGPSLPLSSSSSSSQQHRNKENDADDDYKTSIETKYAKYPLVRGMILHEKARYVRSTCMFLFSSLPSSNPYVFVSIIIYIYTHTHAQKVHLH